MISLRINTEQIIVFVLVDEDGLEVTGLDDDFIVELSKNGAAFAAGGGEKAEVGSGWYSYKLSAAESNTAGLLAVTITAIGVVQQNLLYQITGSIWETVEGPNILSTEEAAAVLRCDDEEPNMLMLLPQIDAYIEQATGRDWTADDTINPTAKSAARMLLVRWHEDPGGMSAGSSLGFGLTAAMVQLEALALTLETEGIPDESLALAGSFPKDGADEISITVNFVLIFNHEMASGAVNAVSLEDASENTVSSTNTLDATGKIITVTPAADLEYESDYTLVIEAAPDVYGQTLSEEIRFRTE